MIVPDNHDRIVSALYDRGLRYFDPDDRKLVLLLAKRFLPETLPDPEVPAEAPPSENSEKPVLIPDTCGLIDHFSNAISPPDMSAYHPLILHSVENELSRLSNTSLDERTRDAANRAVQFLNSTPELARIGWPNSTFADPDIITEATERCLHPTKNSAGTVYVWTVDGKLIDDLRSIPIDRMKSVTKKDTLHIVKRLSRAPVRMQCADLCPTC